MLGSILKKRQLLLEEFLARKSPVPAKWQGEALGLHEEFDKKFSRFVIWGLKKRWHTHRYIHRSFYLMAKKLGIPVLWLENHPNNKKHLLPKDLILTCPSILDSRKSKNHLPLRKGVFYCFHLLLPKHFEDKIEKEYYIILKEYRNKWSELKLPDTQQLFKDDSSTFYNPSRQVLIQSWGTDLLPWEFHSPTHCPQTKNVYWIGSVWQDNMEILSRYRRYLASVGLRWKNKRHVTQSQNIHYIRNSRLAPSISGDQVKKDYIPCRMYKNISYGQLCYTNTPVLQKIYKECHPPVGSLEEMSDYILGMHRDDYLSMVHRQQQITQRHTYLQKMINIVKSF